MSNLNFDANTVEPQQAFDPIPVGKYTMMISDSELKPNSKGTGSYLELVWEMLEGEHKGRKVWDRLNILNANATAQQIAQQKLSAICHATGRMQVNDSAELHNLPCLVKLTIKQDAGYEPSNECKGYEAIGQGSAQPVPPASPAVLPAAANDVDDLPPWAM